MTELHVVIGLGLAVATFLTNLVLICLFVGLAQKLEPAEIVLPSASNGKPEEERTGIHELQCARERLQSPPHAA